MEKSYKIQNTISLFRSAWGYAFWRILMAKSSSVAWKFHQVTVVFTNIYSANLKWPINNYHKLNINNKIIDPEIMSDYLLHFREREWSRLFGPYSCHCLPESKENSRKACLVNEETTVNQWKSLQMTKGIIQPNTWSEFACVTCAYNSHISAVLK